MSIFCTTSFLYTHLIYCLSPFNLTLVVQSGTHISPSGITLIDLIFVSSTSFLYTCSSLPPLGTSDHSGLQLVVKMMCLKKRKGYQWTLRKYSQGDYRKVRHMIDMFDWDSLFCEDINITFQKWQSQFLYIMEQCIPRVSPSSSRLPWLTKTLIAFMKKKNSLFKAWKRERNPTIHSQYKSVRN